MELSIINHHIQSADKLDKRFADILAKFKAMKRLQFSEEEVRKAFTKDELVALIMWFDEQLTASEEGEKQSDLFTEYQEV